MTRAYRNESAWFCLEMGEGGGILRKQIWIDSWRTVKMSLVDK